jgi:HAD superfamily hydrolase (TIGR01458 family)
MFTSLTAARDFLVKNNNVSPYLMIHEDAKEDFEEVGIRGWEASKDKLATSVVIGLAPHMFNYDNMNTAMRIVHTGGDLIAIHKARYYMTGKGDLSLGPGPFVTALEHATDVRAHVVGKPSKMFFESAVSFMSDSLTAQEVVMIGDDVKDDVLGAQEAGMTGILVKTGKYRPGDEGAEGIKPHFVASSIVEAVDIILETLK